MKRLLMLAAAVCILLLSNGAAEAGIFGGCRHGNCCGRWLGLGWSDGYHAACCGDRGSWCGRHCDWCGDCGCSKPCCVAPSCGTPKVVVPGCFGCGARVMPPYAGPALPY